MSKLTLGLVPPAKPAFMLLLPTSITMGWFSMEEAEDDALAASVSLIVEVLA